MRVGEVIRVDDALTGFDLNKPGRPCCIVRVEEPPRSGVWVVPRSTRGTTGTLTPAGTLPGINSDGRFQFIPRFVAAADLEGCESLGLLPEPYLARVLENVNSIVFDVE